MQNVISKFGFDIVHGCQLRCVGCPNSTLKPKIKEITPSDFDACLKNVDVDRIDLFRLFNFGEPLLHKDLPGILEQIPKQSWEATVVEISTNAQYHDFPMLVAAFKTGVLDRIVVSCDGDGTPEDYERLRPPSKWDKLLEFLVRTKQLRDRYAPYITLINRTICVQPESQIRWRKLLDPLGWKPEFRDWRILPEGKNMTGHEPIVPSRICSFMHGDKIYVDYDGTVVPCCVHPRAGVLGNLKDQMLSAILRGEPRRKMLNTMENARVDMRICGQCEF